MKQIFYRPPIKLVNFSGKKLRRGPFSVKLQSQATFWKLTSSQLFHYESGLFFISNRICICIGFYQKKILYCVYLKSITLYISRVSVFIVFSSITFPGLRNCKYGYSWFLKSVWHDGSRWWLQLFLIYSSNICWGLEFWEVGTF